MNDIIVAVKELNPGPSNPVFVTGHSKGGAMASIGAYLLLSHLDTGVVQPVITFASPRPGNLAFRHGFEKMLKQTRYENSGDIVPLVPPRDELVGYLKDFVYLFSEEGKKLYHSLVKGPKWDYFPVGSEKFIKSDHHIVTHESGFYQDITVTREVLKDLLKVNFDSLMAAHSLNPGGGYYQGVTGSIGNK